MLVVRPVTSVNGILGRCLARCVSSSSINYARGAEVGPERVRKPNTNKAPSRQEKIDSINMSMHSKLFKIDSVFNIFKKDVMKVVDLGYVPGNWSSFAKFRMCQVHNLQEDEFKNKCHILGFDLLFATPPVGVSTLQGNIFSKMAHKNIVNHFKELALKEYVQKYQKSLQLEQTDDESVKNSYYMKEQAEVELEKEMEELTKDLGSLSLDKTEEEVKQEEARRESILKKIEYRPDLVLSDLSRPFMQQGGFFNHTQTRPYLRFNVTPGLNNPIIDPQKSLIDLADASLFLSCGVLRTGGTLVLRLASVDAKDSELQVLESRLKKVFKDVKKWTGSGETNLSKQHELVFVCFKKRDDKDYDINDIF
ncbi:FtsJ-like methyltransferase-domain-containing protein [Scheffersomyces xylosifermentans]|uniref:FtsJ-like methyltransferase-domain-containing protein n=1 Tax=Scheffersomyces xylosifermentans TaxID=1304137 RepID=UPI00315D0A58